MLFIDFPYSISKMYPENILDGRNYKRDRLWGTTRTLGVDIFYACGVLLIKYKRICVLATGWLLK